MNWDLAFKAFSAAAVIGSTVCNVYLFFKSRSDERFKKVDERLDAHDTVIAANAEASAEALAEVDKKIAVMAKEIESLPTHDDLEDIRSDVAKIRTDVATVMERSGNLIDSVRRIENHLLGNR